MANEETKVDKIYKKLKELHLEAGEDIKIDKGMLESAFDSSMKTIKWLSKRSDWVRIYNTIEFKRKEAWKKAFEYYKTEYQLKLSNQDEFRLMIESDPNYFVVLQESNAIKEVVTFIESTIDALKSRNYEVSNLTKFIMWSGGHQ